MLYLINCFNSVNAKKPFITDIQEANTEQEAVNKAIKIIHYMDSAKTRLLGKVRKAEVIHQI